MKAIIPFVNSKTARARTEIRLVCVQLGDEGFPTAFLGLPKRVAHGGLGFLRKGLLHLTPCHKHKADLVRVEGGILHFQDLLELGVQGSQCRGPTI